MDQELIGVLDLDSLVVGGFNEEDKEFLTKMAEIVAQGCDWTQILSQ